MAAAGQAQHLQGFQWELLIRIQRQFLHSVAKPKGSEPDFLEKEIRVGIAWKKAAMEEYSLLEPEPEEITE